MKRHPLLIAAALILLDQAFKALAILYTTPGGLFVHVRNPGVTFGFFQEANTLMIALSVLAAGGVLYALQKSKGIDMAGLTIILAGIVGNGIDRVMRGAVIDYISISTFPVFNFADSMIVTGIILLLFREPIEQFLRTRRSRPSRRDTRSSSTKKPGSDDT